MEVEKHIALARECADGAHTMMNDANLLTSLIRVPLMGKKCRSAIDYVNRAVKIEPSNNPFLALAGSTHSTYSNPREGKNYLEQALRAERQHNASYPVSPGSSYNMVG